jgi:hypothetical protein
MYSQRLIQNSESILQKNQILANFEVNQNDFFPSSISSHSFNHLKFMNKYFHSPPNSSINSSAVLVFFRQKSIAIAKPAGFVFLSFCK